MPSRENYHTHNLKRINIPKMHELWHTLVLCCNFNVMAFMLWFYYCSIMTFCGILGRARRSQHCLTDGLTYCNAKLLNKEGMIGVMSLQTHVNINTWKNQISKCIGNTLITCNTKVGHRCYIAKVSSSFHQCMYAKLNAKIMLSGLGWHEKLMGNMLNVEGGPWVFEYPRVKVDYG